MNVEVRRFPQRTIVILDGEPYPIPVAASKLGLKRKTLEKRLQRGTNLLKPLQRHARD